MTEREKEHIIKLRESGMSYSAISREVGMSVGGIKAFFSRCSSHKHKDEQRAYCLYCGTKLPGKQKTKPFKFCSAACRHKWWLENRDYTQTCLNCQQTFHTKHKHQKYCSHGCYIQDRYGKAVDGNA